MLIWLQIITRVTTYYKWFQKISYVFLRHFSVFPSPPGIKKSGYPYGHPTNCVYIMNFRPQAYCLRSEIHGLSHGLKICHRHIFLTAFRAPPGIKKSGDPYGYPASCVYIMNFRPQAYCLRSEIHGLSHGLKICHRHIFLTAFRVPPGIKKFRIPIRASGFFGARDGTRTHTA